MNACHIILREQAEAAAKVNCELHSLEFCLEVLDSITEYGPREDMDQTKATAQLVEAVRRIVAL